MQAAIIILTILVRTEGAIIPHDVAQVRDARTCAVLAEAFNKFTASDPDVAAICREVTPERT